MTTENSKVEQQPPQDSSWNIEIPFQRILGVLFLGGMAVGLCLLSPNPNTSMKAGVRLQLPDSVLGMAGAEQEMSVAEKKILPTDTEFLRKVYHSAEGDQIFCSLVVAGGEKRSIHRPEICLPGQGWTIKSGEVVPLELSDGRKIEAMKLMLEREEQAGPGTRIKIQSVFLYWFVGSNVTTPHHWRRVFLTSWDRVVHGINHRWAYVVVSSTVTKGLLPQGKDEQETLALLRKFAAEATPFFMVNPKAADGSEH